MPYVKSIPLRTTVNRSLAYILNPDKTENLLYTNAVNCLPNAKDAYLAMKWVYEHFSGEKYNAPLPKQGKGSVKAIHYIQSFDPKDNISPELAHKISKAFALKVFGKDSQVVIATHVDKEHIHTHFIVNAYGVDGHKFNDNKETLQKIREESDRVCLAFGIKPIEPKQGDRVLTTANGNTSGEVHHGKKKFVARLTVLSAGSRTLMNCSRSWNISATLSSEGNMFRSRHPISSERYA